jgi:hypothetical protein
MSIAQLEKIPVRIRYRFQRRSKCSKRTDKVMTEVPQPIQYYYAPPVVPNAITLVSGVVLAMLSLGYLTFVRKHFFTCSKPSPGPRAL